MSDQVGLDWPAYFGALRDADARSLASWLCVHNLQVGEFMEVVDRAHATWAGRWGENSDAFINLVGKRSARRYALRKRHFTRLVAMLEEAMASGAFLGEVAPHELDMPVRTLTEPRSVKELLTAFERVSHTHE